MYKSLLLLSLAVALNLICFSLTARPIVIGSKQFTESIVLAELLAEQIRQNFPTKEVVVKQGLGGTGVVFGAVKAGDIDLYIEYSGTIAEAILGKPELTNWQDLFKAVSEEGLIISKPLGFNNTYAFAVRRKFGVEHSLATISDLKKLPGIKAGFSYEWMKRSDGFDALTKYYGIKLTAAKGIEHSLAYSAIENGSVDLIDVYTTDAKIQSLNLKLLEDNKEFFPKYMALILSNKNFVDEFPQVWESLTQLEGTIDEIKMQQMNSIVDLEKKSFRQAALRYFDTDGEIDSEKVTSIQWPLMLQRIQEHLLLVVISMLAAIVVGIPLGIIAIRSKKVSQFILGICGLIQTIPSLALLCFFIPIFGIGWTPALIALFLYSLLPIVRNTYSGLMALEPSQKEVMFALGLDSKQKLLKVELPLASPSILAGIKTSAVINVGTATLAAFIGAGGLGSFIVTGLALNNINIILQGALPAALLALVIQFTFEIGDRFFIPKGLRLMSKVDYS